MFGFHSRVSARSGISFFVFAASVAALLTLPRIVTAQESEPTQDPLAGSEVFESKGCVNCHAVNGIGGQSGPDLSAIPRRRSFYELAANIWNHLPFMTGGMEAAGMPHPEMNAREAADLIGFLFTLEYFDAPGDVGVGKALFSEKKCHVCHRIGDYGGEGGPELDHLGQYVSPILVAASMWNHAPRMSEAMELKGVERPTFNSQEILDLIAYLESASAAPLEGPLYVLPGRAESGRIVFVEKGCNVCHAVQGVGGRVGPDLAGQGRQWGLTEFAAAMWNKAPAMEEAARQVQVHVHPVGAVEMADLVAYLYSVKYFAELGDAERGQETLRDRGCLGCHSLSGSGGISASDFADAGGFESPAAVIATLWNHSLVMEGAPDLQEGKLPTLTEEQLADVTAFLQELQANR
ncbi:MAG TPA: c-type cytochrome [Gemmatimonadota bacterium]|nr:c-type cytochrome [Gemmatimonadota bacterium]